MSARPPLHLAENTPGGDCAAGAKGVRGHLPERAPLPAFAHLPGHTPRHPEGTFEALRATARPGMTEAEIAASPAMRAGLAFLHAGFHWEAHEVLEPVWMALPEGPARQMAQALIQLANARLKDRMDRPRAAARLRAMAASHLARARQGRAGPVLGLDPAEVATWILGGTENVI